MFGHLMIHTKIFKPNTAKLCFLRSLSADLKQSEFITLGANVGKRNRGLKSQKDSIRFFI